MKCPKCNYLGFETGDRCKNCGYDFSLMSTAPAPLPDVTIDRPMEAHTPSTQFWLDQLDEALGKPVLDVPEKPHPVAPLLDMPAPAELPRVMEIDTPPAPRASSTGAPSAVVPMRAEQALPLFTPPTDDDEDDEPLIKLPAAPRPPLAVRKTPDMPRLRAVPRALPREIEPELEFAEEPAPQADLPIRGETAPAPASAPSFTATAPATVGARLAAAATDHAILFGIDLVVVYFTLRMAGLPLDAWTQLPLAPLATFLLLVKFAYFFAFTAVGGQTIGKMAGRLRVVTEQSTPVDARCAIQRTLGGVVSAATLGLGLLAAFADADRRALHDRFAHTRVVALRPA